MRQLLIGLLTLGWLACSVTEPAPPGSQAPPASEAPETSQAVESIQGPGGLPGFSQCVVGASCVFDEDCKGAITNVTCGSGRHCCNPVGCAGVCVAFASFCTAGNQTVDRSAICPSGGVCCITFVPNQ
jgi:hypothetical protein